MGQYLTAAIGALESSTSGVPLKVAALKAVRKYVICVDSDQSPDYRYSFCSVPEDKPIAPLAPRLVAALAPFMSSVTEDTLALVLEALSTVTQVDEGKWVTPDLATTIVGMLLATYQRNVNGAFNSPISDP
jgi:importin-9